MYNWVFEKISGGLVSVVQNYFDKGVMIRIMLCPPPRPKANLIAANPKDPKTLIEWGLLELMYM